MTIEEMRKAKIEKGYSYAMLAKMADLPLGTVEKVLTGITKAPRFSTLRKLEIALTREPKGCVYRDTALLREKAEEYRIIKQESAKDAARNSESTLGLKRQGTYTIGDYEHFPEDERYELIDGVVYDLSSPTVEHQDLAGELYFQLQFYIRRKGGSCHAFIAPLDVKLADDDDSTIVQPDVLIVCDESKVQKKRIVGAPDFIAEVLSPTTSFKDRMVKLAKYRETGVREYWTIDPDREVVTVYDLVSGTLETYGFTDPIPVEIYKGELQIRLADFTDI